MTNDSYDALRSNVTSGANRSKYYETLTSDQKVQVDAFVSFLSNETNFTKATISSYKSYVCKALHKVQSGEKLTNDEKSASRKFLSFLDK